LDNSGYNHRKREQSQRSIHVVIRFAYSRIDNTKKIRHRQNINRKVRQTFSGYHRKITAPPPQKNLKNTKKK